MSFLFVVWGDPVLVGLPTVPVPEAPTVVSALGGEIAAVAPDASALLGLNVVLGLSLGMVDGVLTVLPAGVVLPRSIALGLAFVVVPWFGDDGTASGVAGSRVDEFPEQATDPYRQMIAAIWSFMLFPRVQVINANWSVRLRRSIGKISRYLQRS